MASRMNICYLHYESDKEFSDGSIQLRMPDRIRLRLEALVSPLHAYFRGKLSLDSSDLLFLRIRNVNRKSIQ